LTTLFYQKWGFLHALIGVNSVCLGSFAITSKEKFELKLMQV